MASRGRQYDATLGSLKDNYFVGKSPERQFQTQLINERRHWRKEELNLEGIGGTCSVRKAEFQDQEEKSKRQRLIGSKADGAAPAGSVDWILINNENKIGCNIVGIAGKSNITGSASIPEAINREAAAIAHGISVPATRVVTDPRIDELHMSSGSEELSPVAGPVTSSSCFEPACASAQDGSQEALGGIGVTAQCSDAPRCALLNVGSESIEATVGAAYFPSTGGVPESSNNIPEEVPAAPAPALYLQSTAAPTADTAVLAMSAQPPPTPVESPPVSVPSPATAGGAVMQPAAGQSTLVPRVEPVLGAAPLTAGTPASLPPSLGAGCGWSAVTTSVAPTPAVATLPGGEGGVGCGGIPTAVMGPAPASATSVHPHPPPCIITAAPSVGMCRAQQLAAMTGTGSPSSPIVLAPDAATTAASPTAADAAAPDSSSPPYPAPQPPFVGTPVLAPVPTGDAVGEFRGDGVRVGEIEPEEVSHEAAALVASEESDGYISALASGFPSISMWTDAALEGWLAATPVVLPPDSELEIEQLEATAAPHTPTTAAVAEAIAAAATAATAAVAELSSDPRVAGGEGGGGGGGGGGG